MQEWPRNGLVNAPFFMEQKTYNIFIGHAWAYNPDSRLLKNLLKEQPFFKWKNLSSPLYDPSINTRSSEGKAVLTARLEDSIGKADCVLIIPGTNKVYLDWLRAEVLIAKKKAKPIIAVLPPGTVAIPEFIREAASEVAGWSAASIISAIRNRAGSPGLI
jgi:hypothetical protein